MGAVATGCGWGGAARWDRSWESMTWRESLGTPGKTLVGRAWMASGEMDNVVGGGAVVEASVRNRLLISSWYAFASMTAFSAS